jgi:deazaflavin-dependent oxidoreductase (nitroreductase family)
MIITLLDETASLDKTSGMSVSAEDRKQRKLRRVTWFHQHIAHPMARLSHGQVMLETIGRRSGEPRQVPVGGRVVDGSFWLVSNHGREANYVRNIEAKPRVRVRIKGKWHAGTAHLLDEDDPRQRLRTLPAFNSMMVRALGTDLLTVRIDLDS